MAELSDYIEFVRAGAKHYGIEPDLAFAMFEQESQWDPKAVGSSGEIGVAQLMPETAKGLGVNPHDTWENIDGGLRYLKQQLDKYKDPSLALAAYNAGPGAVDKAKGIPQNAETPGHVQKVMSRYNDICMQRFAAGKEAPGEESKAFDVTKPVDVLGTGDALTTLMSGAGQPAADFYKFLGGIEAKWQQTGEMAQSAQQKIQDLALTEGGAGQLPLMPSGKPSSLVGAPLLATDLAMKPRPTVPAAYPAHELMAMDWPEQPKMITGRTLEEPLLPPAEEQPYYKQGQKIQSMLDAMRMPGPVGDILHSAGTVGGIMVGTQALSSPAAVATIASGTPGMEALYAIAPKAVETFFRYMPAATAGAIIGQAPGYEAAREAGKDPQESAEIAQWNMLVGTSMAAPVGQMLSKLDRFAGGGLRKTLWEMAKSGTSFAGTMAFMNSMNNVVAKLNYDELRGVMQGVLENVPKDFAVGALLFGLGRAAKRTMEGKAKEDGKPVPPEVYEFDERSKTWWEQVSPERWIEAEAEPGLEIPGQDEVASEVAKTPVAKAVTPTDLEKKLQKIEKRDYSANQVERTRKYYKDNYGIDLEVQDSEVKGKFRLVRKAPVEVASTPTEPTELTLEQELQQNHEAAAEEIPPDVLTAPEEPMLTQEMRDALTAAREGKRAAPEGLPLTDAERASLRHGLDLAAKWREEQAAKRAKESEDAASIIPAEQFFHGNPNPNLRSSADMPKGHRGYFVTTSPQVAQKFTSDKGRVYEVTIDKDSLFDARNPEDLARFQAEWRRKGYTWSPSELSLRRGNHATYEDYQVQSTLEELGYKGNWQIEDGADVYRVFSRKQIRTLTPYDATSVNRVDIGKEGLTEAEQTEIDDKVVDAYEKTKSYVQAAKKVGLSIAETKARHKYATGLTEKRPYDIVEEKAQPTERTLETPTEPYTDVSDALEKAGKVSGAKRVEAPPTFASQKEARTWLLENKKEGTIASTGAKFKILDLKDASAYDLFSLSPNMLNPSNVRGIKDFFDRRLEAIGAPDEIKRAYLADDMGNIESWAAQTQWLVDKNPRLYPIFETTHNMIGRAGVGVQEAIQSWAERWIALKPESKQRATDFEVDLDRKAEQFRKAGKAAYEDRGITESRFVKTSAGNIRLNPKFHEQWYEKTRPLFSGTQEEFDLIFEHRKMYDKIAEAKWNMSRKYYKRGSNDLKRLREEVFLLQDYFPHQRDGEFALGGYVTDAEGNRSKVYDHAFDIPKALYAAQKMGNKFEVRKTDDKASYGTFKDKGAAESAAKKLGPEYYASDTGIRAIEGFVRNVIMPRIANDPILAQLQIPEGGWQIERRESPYIQSLANNPHTAMALQYVTSRVSREIMKDKTKTPAEKAQLLGPYTKLWNEAIAETLRKGTLGGHWATRSGIHGYAVDDAGKVAHKYATQFYRTLAKMETATELTKLIKEVKGDRPNEAKWAARYMERVLDPDYDLVGIVGGLRSLSYFSMINPIRFFGVNLTNGVVSGAQQIVADTGNVAWKYIPKAIWDATRWYMKKTKLPAEEERMLKELHDNGVLRPQFLDAISRRLEADPEAKSLLWWKIKNVITTPARSSEIISRLYTALAAFRAANDGLVSSERAKERFGSAITERVKGPMTDEQYQRNIRYAAKIVDDSHMIWGELNRPEIVTRGAVGKALGSALIFRHYSQGLFHMWKSLYGEGGNRGYGKMAMAESLAAQMLLGGTIAGGILNGFYQAIFGTNMWDDARKYIGSTATDLLEYGAPSLVGLNMHSSFDLEPPEAWDELFGVPASIVKNWSKAWKAASVKDYQKAFEYTVPLKIARDLSVAIRLGTEGLTTAGGSPVSAPGSSEPYKISLPEAVGQAAGFSPMSTTHLWEAQEATMSMEQRRQNAQDAWVTRYTNALRRGDQKEMTSVIDEAVAWNDKWISKGVPQLAVDIGPAIKQRMKPVQPSRKMRGLAREMQERALRMQQD